MSVVGVSSLTHDLEHVPGLLDQFTADPADVLAGYAVDAVEEAAIRSRDAEGLLRTGVNPIVLRNLFVLLGIPHRHLFG